MSSVEDNNKLSDAMAAVPTKGGFDLNPANDVDLAMISDTKIGRWIMNLLKNNKSQEDASAYKRSEESLLQMMADMDSEERNTIEDVLKNISNPKLINDQRFMEIRQLNRNSLNKLINPDNYFEKSEEEDTGFVASIIGGGKPLSQVTLSEQGKSFFSSEEGKSILEMFGMGILWGKDFNATDQFVKDRLGGEAASTVLIYALKAVNKVAEDNSDFLREKGFEDIHNNMNQEEMNRFLVSITINENGQFRYNHLMGLFYGFPLEAVIDRITNQQALISFSVMLNKLFPMYFKTLKNPGDFSGFGITKNSLWPAMKTLENRYRGVNTVSAILDDKIGGDEATKGGIDLNPTILSTEIKRNGRGVIIPAFKGVVPDLNGMEGFVPNIINVTPITNLQLLLGLDTKLNDNPPNPKNEKPVDVSFNLSALPAKEREEAHLELVHN